MSELDTNRGHNLDEFLHNLAETIVWVRQRLDITAPGQSLRTAKTRPHILSESRKEAVEDIAFKRRLELCRPELPPAGDLAGGRLFVYMPDETLREGACELETSGFFDVEDVPPWDTWVAYFYENGADPYTRGNNYLVCWVPPQLFETVQRAINVSSTDCVPWIEGLARDIPDSPVIELARRLASAT